MKPYLPLRTRVYRYLALISIIAVLVILSLPGQWIDYFWRDYTSTPVIELCREHGMSAANF